MIQEKLVCTTCACLCDDIEVEIEENRISKIRNACRKGSSLIYASQSDKRHASYLIYGQKVSQDEAVEKTSRLLNQAESPLLFGFDNSTLEAQSTAIELAEALGATIDDTSSFRQGELVQTILSNLNPTCSLDEAKDADLVIYWGSNPYHSHPRHLSHFSYYTHPKYEEAGWFPESRLISIEVRDTETTEICDKSFRFFRILPGEDPDFIASVLAIIEGKKGREDAGEFLKSIKSSSFCVIYAGPGLDYSLDGEYQTFNRMVNRLGECTRIAVIPMIDPYNMRGFNQLLFDKTGFVNRVNFANGASHGLEFSFLEQVRNNVPDCILIAGSDPLSSLPDSLVKNLGDITIITLDPFLTATTRISDVVLGIAVSGLETGGNAIRMDGTEISLNRVISTSIPGDEEIIRRLLDMVKR
ncbi:MAG: formylmethanofuran dehydrogenase subunit B [Deltaproteobacteria bacterium CG12_big_fil_rev_8_21_14_0_65_43_10]|nr:MAG: formylmethanofuran dehydrogenase subunit B [Deltaproteobacteria bacterium CG2_30_43_15]PIQ45469.1 MAG: formylmethanofuran dehydrogenase subunit B [Deltaproteobacteria bacterium CG12_big_fil_rev_8_21_14_0_65_43_10]PIU85172.1 MAG: formylmethanofuran dehydrogenase subunit B [Deltaproteobacteria bacterium CG06_land_8_20_14_3_00_44_19]PIX21926.1 MAG: formylmethanofuran dehydrogenase subunit B [Deltaproteobacteria bacterium CG_4_8_14_3_um_filter_43_13]PIZ18592.1 MAG: formylmethanofuran dehydr